MSYLIDVQGSASLSAPGPNMNQKFSALGAYPARFQTQGTDLTPRFEAPVVNPTSRLPAPVGTLTPSHLNYIRSEDKRKAYAGPLGSRQNIGVDLHKEYI